MHLLDQRFLGGGILLLLAALVCVKRAATGSVLDRPTGSLLVRTVNVFNLCFLLIVNPLAAVLLLTGRLDVIDPFRLATENPRALLILESAGLLLYVSGFLIMAWALMTLGRNYQLGGQAPRAEDQFVVSGPYGLVRHPMYAAALAIALGLTCLIQSWAFAAVFCVYLALIVLLIPKEEAELRRAYGGRYATYERESSRLVPFVY